MKIKTFSGLDINSVDEAVNKFINSSAVVSVGNILMSTCSDEKAGNYLKSVVVTITVVYTPSSYDDNY